MDYSDATVIIPIKDEPAAEQVAREAIARLQGCKVIVVYKGLAGFKFRHKSLRLIKQTGSGKGNAVIQAAKYVNTGIICLIDGDGTYEVRDLRKVIAMVRDGADMALGNRMHNISEKTMPGYIQFGNNVLTATGNILYGIKIHDSQTGLRAIRTEVFRALRLRESYFGIESEMNIKCRKNHYRIAEIPTKYHVRVGVSKQFKLVDGLKLFLLNFKLLFD
jgi:dolichol-phosphate hexosyltransferase